MFNGQQILVKGLDNTTLHALHADPETTVEPGSLDMCFALWDFEAGGFASWKCKLGQFGLDPGVSYSPHSLPVSESGS